MGIFIKIDGGFGFPFRNLLVDICHQIALEQGWTGCAVRLQLWRGNGAWQFFQSCFRELLLGCFDQVLEAIIHHSEASFGPMLREAPGSRVFAYGQRME